MVNVTQWATLLSMYISIHINPTQIEYARSLQLSHTYTDTLGIEEHKMVMTYSFKWQPCDVIKDIITVGFVVWVVFLQLDVEIPRKMIDVE